MREESHLDDMRSAIRGDFERLAERRGGQELMRSSENAAEDISRPEPEPEHTPEPQLEPDPEPEPVAEAPELEPEPEPRPQEELPDDASDEQLRRSFWDRVFGR